VSCNVTDAAADDDDAAAADDDDANARPKAGAPASYY
jgi:hypothetical protein